MNALRRRRRLLIAAGTLCLLSAVPAYGSAAQSPDAELQALEEAAVELLNAERRAQGLSPLLRSTALDKLARYHSGEQVRLGRVSHHSYDFDLSTERRLRISFPTTPRLGENVARNRNVERLHRALLRSEGHRRNRLDPAFTHVGIGLARSGDHVLYMTEVFAGVAAGGPLGEPVAYYFDAAPGSYESRENPRAELGPETITIGAPGPDNPEYWTSLGIDAFQEGDLETAAAHFRHSLELYPTYAYARYNLARTLLYQGGYDEAAALLDGLLESDPDDHDVRATRGNIALLQQDFAAAEAAFRQVLTARPDDAAAWYNLGLALEYLERLKDAENAYRQALDIEPGLIAAQAALGRLRRR